MFVVILKIISNFFYKKYKDTVLYYNVQKREQGVTVDKRTPVKQNFRQMFCFINFHFLITNSFSDIVKTIENTNPIDFFFGIIDIA